MIKKESRITPAFLILFNIIKEKIWQKRKWKRR